MAYLRSTSESDIGNGETDMMNYSKPKFEIVRHAGQVDVGMTVDGIPVHRQDKIWVEEGEKSRFIACPSDDMHFIFIDPNWKKIVGRWFAYCTCGSIAVIVGSLAYKEYSSPSMEGTIKGEMLICYEYAQTGHHFPVNWEIK